MCVRRNSCAVVMEMWTGCMTAHGQMSGDLRLVHAALEMVNPPSHAGAYGCALLRLDERNQLKSKA